MSRPLLSQNTPHPQTGELLPPFVLRLWAKLTGQHAFVDDALAAEQEGIAGHQAPALLQDQGVSGHQMAGFHLLGACQEREPLRGALWVFLQPLCCTPSGVSGARCSPRMAPLSPSLLWPPSSWAAQLLPLGSCLSQASPPPTALQLPRGLASSGPCPILYVKCYG